MRVLIFQHIACEHPGTFRDFMRDEGVEMHTVELDIGESIPSFDEFDVLMVMGGPMDVWQKAKHPWLEAEITSIRNWVVEERRPFLGFCLGHQLLAETLGGTVDRAQHPEIGVMSVALTEAGRQSPLLRGVADEISCFQWHSAEVTRAPEGAEVLASSPACAINAMCWGDLAFSIQFHVEITPTMVTRWGEVPEYRSALEQALGDGGFTRLQTDTARQESNLKAISRRLYSNFMDIARQA